MHMIAGGEDMKLLKIEENSAFFLSKSNDDYNPVDKITKEREKLGSGLES